MTTKQEQLEAMGAQTMTFGGSSTAVASGYFGLHEWGIIVGIIIGVCGFAFQAWLGLNRNRRERELHRKRMNDTAEE